MIKKFCHSGEKSHLMLGLQVKSELRVLLTFPPMFFWYTSFSLIPVIICSIHKWNVFVKDKIGHGYICYINDRYFVYFIAIFVGKYNFSTSHLLAWCLFKGFGKSCRFTCRINLYCFVESDIWENLSMVTHGKKY